MPQVYTCEFCHKLVDVHERYLVVEHIIAELEGSLRGRVHLDCWEKYLERSQPEPPK